MDDFDFYFSKFKILLSDDGGVTLGKLKAEAETVSFKYKKTPIDLALRDRLLHLLSFSSLEDIKSLLKIGVASALADICSASTPFILFSDVFNTKTIEVCEEIFPFMEETISALKDMSLFASGRNTLLRMCNGIFNVLTKYIDLVRRLSKTQNTVFCGRIQLFLSRLFPLDEKSGLNLMSSFNTEKEVSYNRNPDSSLFSGQRSTNGVLDDLEEGEMVDLAQNYDSNTNFKIVDSSLYVSFWSLQDFFKVPLDCYDKSKWVKFSESVEAVLKTFSSIRLPEADEFQNRWRSLGANFSKYLTSEKLLDLQLMDMSFRRYILVQLLILFQYLTATVKFKGPLHVLSDGQIKWLSEKRALVRHLLAPNISFDQNDVDIAESALGNPDANEITKEQTKDADRGKEREQANKNEREGNKDNKEKDRNRPSSEDSVAGAITPNSQNGFLACLEHVLDRENAWNQWKNDGCPSFVRSPEKSSLAPRKRRANPLIDRSGTKIFRFANKELDRLWNVCPDNVEACKDKQRLFQPELRQYFADAILELDPEEKVEEDFKSINREEWSWRALRLLSRRCLCFYTNWTPAGRQIKEYLSVILKEKLSAEEERRTGFVSSTSSSCYNTPSKHSSDRSSTTTSSSSAPSSIDDVSGTGSNPQVTVKEEEHSVFSGTPTQAAPQVSVSNRRGHPVNGPTSLTSGSPNASILAQIPPKVGRQSIVISSSTEKISNTGHPATGCQVARSRPLSTSETVSKPRRDVSASSRHLFTSSSSSGIISTVSSAVSVKKRPRPPSNDIGLPRARSLQAKESRVESASGENEDQEEDDDTAASATINRTWEVEDSDNQELNGEAGEEGVELEVDEGMEDGEIIPKGVGTDEEDTTSPDAPSQEDIDETTETRN